MKNRIVSISLAMALVISLICNVLLYRRQAFYENIAKINLNKSDLPLPVYPYTKPSEVLYMIYNYEVRKEFDKLPDLIQDVLFKTSSDSPEILHSSVLIIAGIKEQKRFTKAFSYTSKGVLYHAGLVDTLAHVPNEEEINKYFKNYSLTGIDPYMKKVIFDKDRWQELLLYTYQQTFIAFVKINGSYKLLISSNLDQVYEKE